MQIRKVTQGCSAHFFPNTNTYALYSLISIISYEVFVNLTRYH